jgi:hypothetical protein
MEMEYIKSLYKYYYFRFKLQVILIFNITQIKKMCSYFNLYEKIKNYAIIMFSA